MLVGCATVAAPTLTPTPSPTRPQPTFTPTATYTPSPTPTQTPTPTPIGASEPKVAFKGKDSTGGYGLYVDGFYTRKPEKIAALPEYVIKAGGFSYAYLYMRWSPDGETLIYIAGVPKELSIFLYDVITGNVREIASLPDQYALGLTWSNDGSKVFFSTYSGPQRRDWEIELSSGKMTQIDRLYGVNSYFHDHSSIDCDNSLPSIKSIKSLDNNNELEWICFYPDLNAHGALKKNEETTELVLLSPTGEVDKILVKFPARFATNGFVGLSLSPDKSQILIVGDGGIDSSGHPFVYLTRLNDLPLDKSDPTLFPKEYDHEKEMRVHFYGWSPDGQNYLVASGYGADYKLAIVSAASGETLYEYRIPREIEPAIEIYQDARGIEMIWTSDP